jgi:hypothetical protein
VHRRTAILAPCDILHAPVHKKGQPDVYQDLAFFKEKTETV